MAKYNLSQEEMNAVIEQVIDDTYEMMRDRIAASWSMHKALRIVACATNENAFLQAKVFALMALQQAHEAGFKPSLSDDDLVSLLQADTHTVN